MSTPPTPPRAWKRVGIRIRAISFDEVVGPVPLAIVGGCYIPRAPSYATLCVLSCEGPRVRVLAHRRFLSLCVGRWGARLRDVLEDGGLGLFRLCIRSIANLSACVQGEPPRHRLCKEAQYGRGRISCQQPQCPMSSLGGGQRRSTSTIDWPRCLHHVSVVGALKVFSGGLSAAC